MVLISLSPANCTFLMLVSDGPATLDQRRRLTCLHPILVLPRPALYCLPPSPVIKLLPGGQLLAMREKQQLLCRLLLLKAVDLQGVRHSHGVRHAGSSLLLAGVWYKCRGVSVYDDVCVCVCVYDNVCVCVCVRTRLAIEFVTMRCALDA